MSTYLTTLVHEGVDMFCKAVKKERQLSLRAIERVQHAAFNRGGDEAERIAAEEALCEVLIDKLRVDKWWEQVTDDSKAAAFARAIAVAHELVRSAGQDKPYYREAERDGNQALEMLRRGMSGEFQEEVDRECMDARLSEFLPRLDLKYRARKVLEVPETKVEELFAFGAAGSSPEMTFDPDPWWEPGSAPHRPASPAVPVNRPKANGESETPTQEVLANLLVAFTTQYGAYTTLLWQVPALSLTAQSFLLTIALTHDSSNAARLIAAGLSIVIARVSSSLMHAQRGHAMNHGELALRISKKLHLARHLGTLQIEDAKPEKTDAETVWMAVDHRIYHVWLLCLNLFFIADVIIVILVIISAFSGKSFGNIY